MTDSEIEQLAQQLAVTNRQMIIDEIDRRWRAPSGVVSGGPYGSFSVNDQGLIIEASASGGGITPFLARYGVSTGFTLTSGNTKRVNFSFQYDDFDSIVTTGASWKMNAPANGYYTFIPKLYLEIQGDPTGGNAVWIYHVNVTTGVTTIIWQYDAADFNATAVNRFIGFPFTIYMDSADEAYIKLENGLGVDIVVSGGSSGRKINVIDIFKGRLT